MENMGLCHGKYGTLSMRVTSTQLSFPAPACFDCYYQSKKYNQEFFDKKLNTMKNDPETSLNQSCLTYIFSILTKGGLWFEF